MNDMLSNKLELEHKSGEKLYPMKMKNRDTGCVAFRLSKRGNTKSDSIEVVDELEMITKVINEGYMVRARTVKTGGRSGLYRLGQQSISSYKTFR